MEPEALHVLAPPFVKCEVVKPHGRRRRSFLRKKREQLPSPAAGLGTVLFCFLATHIGLFFEVNSLWLVRFEVKLKFTLTTPLSFISTKYAILCCWLVSGLVV